MNDALIIAALAGVTVIAAILSFVAWNLLGRRQAPGDRDQLDSEDPGDTLPPHEGRSI